MEKQNKTIITGSDFSGVGAFDQALKRIGFIQNKKFVCDMDKFARQTYILNYGEPIYFPLNVYDREIPVESLDIYMTSPPCQAFSNIGSGKGEGDERGVLFYNSHEFIEKNKPRFFIFENVKGLLSDDDGKTFRRWLDFLGGKTINGQPVLFPHEKSVPYHVYYFVLNAKDYNIPQNRERIFIVGIRDDDDNFFRIPKPKNQTVFVSDFLEKEIKQKYYLSNKTIKSFSKEKVNFTGKFRPLSKCAKHVYCITTNSGGRHTDNFIKDEKGIRRLTPRECFNFMDFPKDFKWDVSDRQAFKQAGNSIPVGLLVEIIKKLNL